MKEEVKSVVTNDLKQENEILRKKLNFYQKKLIELEKLVTLGKLIAGLTHEINTPIGAINAASGTLQKSVPSLIEKLPNLLKNLSEDTQTLFYQLIEAISREKSQSLSSREERRKRKVIQKELENNNIPNARTLATTLVRLGLHENLTPFIPLLTHSRSKELLEMASVIGKLNTNLKNISVAVEKILKMISAVRDYSYKKETEKPIPVDLIKNVEIVLTLYHNMLKYGIKVTKNFDTSLEPIFGYPDELSQIWTNLIHNAAQAMDGKGELTITIQKLEKPPKWLMVAITDNGPGIPPDIKDKIFQPFFTTKPKGEGTGLGLDIVKRIVAKHKGKIKVISRPGETSFIIFLPTNLDELVQKK